MSVFVNDLGGEGENPLQLGLASFSCLGSKNAFLSDLGRWEAGRGLVHEFWTLWRKLCSPVKSLVPPSLYPLDSEIRLVNCEQGGKSGKISLKGNSLKERNQGERAEGYQQLGSLCQCAGWWVLMWGALACPSVLDNMQSRTHVFRCSAPPHILCTAAVANFSQSSVPLDVTSESFLAQYCRSFPLAVLSIT